MFLFPAEGMPGCSLPLMPLVCSFSLRRAPSTDQLTSLMHASVMNGISLLKALIYKKLLPLSKQTFHFVCLCCGGYMIGKNDKDQRYKHFLHVAVSNFGDSGG